MADITFEVVKEFGILSEEKGGWKKELNLIAWNGRAPKIDIRDWSPDHEKMGKGLTFTREEAIKLKELLETALSDAGSVRDQPCDLRTQRGNGLLGHPIATLVIFVPSVALHPPPIYVSARSQLVQFLP